MLHRGLSTGSLVHQCCAFFFEVFQLVYLHCTQKPMPLFFRQCNSPTSSSLTNLLFSFCPSLTLPSVFPSLSSFPVLLPCSLLPLLLLTPSGFSSRIMQEGFVPEVLNFFTFFHSFCRPYLCPVIQSELFFIFWGSWILCSTFGLHSLPVRHFYLMTCTLEIVKLFSLDGPILSEHSTVSFFA